MFNASVKGHCAADRSDAAATVTVNVGELKLKASCSESTFNTGPTFDDLSLSLEKPGSFTVDYLFPKQDIRFQFMNSFRVLDKQLNMVYTHSRREKSLGLDAALLINSCNKVSANYRFDSKNCKLKYSYNQKGGGTTFEPCYDVFENSWDFAVSQRIRGDDVVRASYQTSTKILGFQWSRASPFGGSFKVSASVNLAEEAKIPKLSAESIWNVDM